MKKFSYFVFTLLAVFCFTLIAFASPTTYDRNDYDNYGVNKKWKITSSNKDNVLNTYYVDASEKIYDFAGVLTNKEKELLKEKIDDFIEKYNTDFVILIDDYEYDKDSDNEDYAADFYDYNDFGIDYEYYDGILLFRNTYSLDPYYDMYTFGNAQLYFIGTSRYDIILDGIYSDLHMGNYYSGLSDYIEYVDLYFGLGMPEVASNYHINKNGYITKNFSINYILIIVISAIATAIIIGVMVSKNKMVKKATEAREYLDKSNSLINARNVLISDNTTRTYIPPSTSSGGSGGSFHSSGGSSGGGHSSGGGRHG